MHQSKMSKLRDRVIAWMSAKYHKPRISSQIQFYAIAMLKVSRNKFEQKYKHNTAAT